MERVNKFFLSAVFIVLTLGLGAVITSKGFSMKFTSGSESESKKEEKYSVFELKISDIYIKIDNLKKDLKNFTKLCEKKSSKAKSCSEAKNFNINELKENLKGLEDRFLEIKKSKKADIFKNKQLKTLKEDLDTLEETVSNKIGEFKIYTQDLLK